MISHRLLLAFLLSSCGSHDVESPAPLVVAGAEADSRELCTETWSPSQTLFEDERLEALRVTDAARLYADPSDVTEQQAQQNNLNELSAHLLLPEVAQAATAELARVARTAIAAEDFGRLADMIGPSGLCVRGAKGADCVPLSRSEVEACTSSIETRFWGRDSGADLDPITCHEVLTGFRAASFASATLSFNHFPLPCRGNNCSGVIIQPAGRVYAEFNIPEGEDTNSRSLWFVFDGSPGCLVLTEVMSEYWGI